MNEELKHLKKSQEKLEAMKKTHPMLKAKLIAQQKVNALKINQIQKQLPKVVLDKSIKTQYTIETNDLGANTMNNQYGHPMKYLSQQNAMLDNQLRQLEDQMNKEAQLLKQYETRAKHGQVSNQGPQELKHNLQGFLGSKMMPGNLGDINSIVWPFWFTSTKTTLAPNQQTQANVTVTQEAAFIWLGYTKAVFIEKAGEAGEYLFVDPDQAGSAGKSNGLTFIIRDSQSSRQFMNKPMNINNVGHWKKPTVIDTPQLILPNSNIEFNFTNDNQTVTYRPFITLFGLRVRIEYAKDILSLVNA